MRTPRYACRTSPVAMSCRDDRAHGVRRDREADAVRASRLALDLRVDADDAAAVVEQRAAGVAVVDRGVGLDRVRDREVVRRRHLAMERADDAARDRALEPERASQREHRRRRRRPRSSRRAGAARGAPRDASTRITARSVDAIGADELGVELDAVREAHRDRRRAGDDVLVRDDVALLVEDEARSLRADPRRHRPRSRRPPSTRGRRSRSR